MACGYFNFTKINGTIFFEEHFIEKNRNNAELAFSGEVLVDYATSLIYLVFTDPFESILPFNWIPLNTSEAIALAYCNPCGFYGTQDNGSK